MQTVRDAIDALNDRGLIGGRNAGPPGGSDDWTTLAFAPIRQIAGPRGAQDIPALEFEEHDPVSDTGPIARERTVFASPGVLSRTDRRAIDERVAREGLDVLAQYRSFHFGSHDWGIYVRQSGILRVREHIIEGSGCSTQEGHDVALELLVGHEYFHHLVDMSATLFELSVDAPLYSERLRLQQERSPGYDPLEEGLANEYALRRIRTATVRAAAAGFLGSAPPGYRDFAMHRGRRRLRSLRSLAGSLLSGGTDDTPLVLGEVLFDERTTITSPGQVPTYVVLDAPDSGGLWFVHQITALTESAKFSKQLARLDRSGFPAAQKWAEAKQRLAQSTSDPGLHFEKLVGSGRTFSIRLSIKLRAKLTWDGELWRAVEIGDHTIYEKW